MLKVSLALVALALVSGCASRGVHFDGSTRPSLVGSAQVRELDSLPEDYERLGHASVRCTSVEGKRPPDGSRLSDVDCSQSRLLAALQERASEVGGIYSSAGAVARGSRTKTKRRSRSRLAAMPTSPGRVATPSAGGRWSRR